jgi:hypothetical protein
MNLNETTCTTFTQGASCVCYVNGQGISKSAFKGDMLDACELTQSVSCP